MLARTTSTPSPLCAARAPRSVGRYSMMRYTRGTRASGYTRAAQERLSPLPPMGRGVGAVEPRPTAWGWSTPHIGPQHNHAKSMLRGACSALRPPLLNGAKNTWDARDGI